MAKKFSLFWVLVFLTYLALPHSGAMALGFDEDQAGPDQSSNNEGSWNESSDQGDDKSEQEGEETKEPPPPPKKEQKTVNKAKKQQKAEEPQEDELLSLEAQKEIESRIKVIEKKFFTKAMRLEISPYFGVLPQDSLMVGISPGARIDFFITESFGLEVMGGGVFNFKKDMLKYADKKNWYFDESRPKWMAGANILWSPFYGKFSFLTEWLVNFDFFLSVGFVAVGSESVNRYSSRDTENGTHPGGSIGLGWKLFVTKWFAPRIDVSYLFYMEKFADPKGQKHEDPTQFRDNVLVSLGFSFYPY
ncbi:MAG: outer membrane beta-barrel domain-containing protein [Deltaproteobacteria bacterium]|nr:outer membrane beta-barrel domain-containing protein [Deltaproteobacteria bacterium]